MLAGTEYIKHNNLKWYLLREISKLQPAHLSTNKKHIDLANKITSCLLPVAQSYQA